MGQGGSGGSPQGKLIPALEKFFGYAGIRIVESMSVQASAQAAQASAQTAQCLCISP